MSKTLGVESNEALKTEYEANRDAKEREEKPPHRQLEQINTCFAWSYTSDTNHCSFFSIQCTIPLYPKNPSFFNQISSINDVPDTA